jgi:hypothetical protein
MPDPTVRDMLLAKVDELVDRMTRDLEEARTVTEQLHPERARSCRNAITMASVMIDEMRLRAHARPLVEGGTECPDDITSSLPLVRGSSKVPALCL